MKGLWIPAFLLLATATAVGAQTQEDIQEAQRCVFRCLDSYKAETAEYDQCVATKCNGPESQSPDASVSGSNGTEDLGWTFVVNSVQASLDGGGIFFSCNPDENMVLVGVTNTLFTGEHLTLVFDDGTQVGIPRSPDYSSTTTVDACMSVGPLANGRILYFVEGKAAGARQTPTGVETTFEQDGAFVTFTDPAEIAQKLRSRTLSLRGSAQAVEQLYAVCPHVLADLRDGCGYSD